MKKYNIIFICLIFILGTACSDQGNLFDEFAVRGGFIQFESGKPNLSFNVFNLQTTTPLIDNQVLIDPNNNATRYSLSLTHQGNTVEDFKVLTTFPSSLTITVEDVLTALGTTIDGIRDSSIDFVATVTTPDGVFNGNNPNIVDGSGNLGGDTNTRIKFIGFNDAMVFKIDVFTPPPTAIRKTSFEEVAIGAAGDTYFRNGGADETIDLINGDNPPFVDFTATGTGSENEIGFNTEYYAVANISSSGLGFVNERVGVYSLFEQFTDYADGTQGFHIEDPDGGIRINFDTVNIPAGQENSGIRFSVYFGNTSWESRDGMYAYVNITTDAGSDVIEMANLFDNDVEAIAGEWVTFDTGFLTGIRSYQLVIEAQSGATPESFDIDNIIIYQPDN